MAPEVVLRKLRKLRLLLRDLEPYADASLEEVVAEHYKVERILELLTTASADLLQHLLTERDVTATSYRDVFRQAASRELLDPALARRLEDAAGMRNVLVHLYEDIDLEILHASIGRALDDFTELVTALAPFAEEPASPSAEDD